MHAKSHGSHRETRDLALSASRCESLEHDFAGPMFSAVAVLWRGLHINTMLFYFSLFSLNIFPAPTTATLQLPYCTVFFWDKFYRAAAAGVVQYYKVYILV